MRYPIAIERAMNAMPLVWSFPIFRDVFLRGIPWTKRSTTPREAHRAVAGDRHRRRRRVPEPGTITEHQANPEFSGWVWACRWLSIWPNCQTRWSG